MKYLPLFIDLNHKSVLVIGGGSVAARKVKILLQVGAIIKIVAHTLCTELKKEFLLQNICWIGKNFKPIMLETVVLVIVATNDDNLNNLIYNMAQKYHVLINTVDDQRKCSCIFPAIVDRSPLLIGISSGGTAPVLVRILREKFEAFLPQSLGYLTKLAGLWRDRVKSVLSQQNARRVFWEIVFYKGHVAMLIEKGYLKEANKYLENLLKNVNNNVKNVGYVILVGAGPGDKELLTIRGLQAIQKADIILYDYLVSKGILELSRRDAKKICVGKRSGKHLISQLEINNFMIKLARLGNVVVRLKGGDSFVFGRGGEEIEQISKSGILFQVVPGITAGIGSAAYAGIPLTHRDYAHSVSFVTGHSSVNRNKINWKIYSDNRQTLVVYMGSKNSKIISENLIFYGRQINTPVAIISKGTCPDQKVLISTLKNLKNLTITLPSPILLIIGNVVSLYKKNN